MELLNEENGVLLVKSSGGENALMRAVLRACLDFDPALWEELDEQDIQTLITAWDKRGDQAEIVMTHKEFSGLFGLMSAAAHAVDITRHGIEAQPVEDLMEDFSRIIEQLPPQGLKYC